jgi:ribonuclease HI
MALYNCVVVSGFRGAMYGSFALYKGAETVYVSPTIELGAGSCNLASYAILLQAMEYAWEQKISDCLFVTANQLVVAQCVASPNANGELTRAKCKAALLVQPNSRVIKALGMFKQWALAFEMPM